MARRLLLLLVLTLLPLNAPQAAGSAATPPAKLEVGGAEIDVYLTPARYAVTSEQLLQWIDAAAGAVSHYYGRFPVRHLHLAVIPREGSAGISATTYGTRDGGYIRLSLGTEARLDDPGNDWVMTHEMVHLAFPQMEREHHWIEEGLATYVEPLARAEVGQLTPQYVWQEAVEGLPKGLPGPGDQGLDRTHTWGRTYWGGALFCLLADVQIRERTHNRYGLQDALRGILAAGGNISTEADIGYSLETGDKAVGVPVLAELYAAMKDRPVTPDLPALWKKLGIIYQDGKISFDDSAPDAAIRKAMTAAGTR